MLDNPDLVNLILNYLETKYWKEILVDTHISYALKKIIIKKIKYHFEIDNLRDYDFFQILFFQTSFLVKIINL
jgi:hypothetical protein